jgi:hypothetical protein
MLNTTRRVELGLSESDYNRVKSSPGHDFYTRVEFECTSKPDPARPFRNTNLQ